MSAFVPLFGDKRISNMPALHFMILSVRDLDYFNELLIDVNMLLRLVPRPFTAAIIASEIPAAIRPYSIAVAPV